MAKIRKMFDAIDVPFLTAELQERMNQVIQDDNARRASRRVKCGARTRTGSKCKALSVPGKRRCKWHGGCSTGPKSAAGKAKSALNLPRREPRGLGCFGITTRTRRRSRRVSQEAPSGS